MVSCVVYAARMKPARAEGGAAGGRLMPSVVEGGRLQVAGLVGTTLGLAREKPNRESTTNAHDWVWLGKKDISLLLDTFITAYYRLINTCRATSTF